MPRRTVTTRRFTAGPPIFLELGRTQTGFLDRNKWPANAEGDRVVYAGAVCAIVSGGLAQSDMTGAQPYIVPYSVGADYGTGSDTPAGILAETWDSTYSDWQITLVDRGTAIEKYCYLPGAPNYGNISDAVKTALTLVKWRS